MLKPGSKLGLSGILSWQGEDVVEAYSEYFDDVKVEKERNGWCLVTGVRKQM
jgi:ribosomal protein L11 methylase PrmA